jgi:hypothetical protein
MNIRLLPTFAVVMLLSVTGPYGGETKPEATEELIKQAKAVSRRSKVEETRAAYEKVFATKDLTLDQRIAAHMDIARVIQRQRRPKMQEAVEEYGKILKFADLAPDKKYPVLMALAKAEYRSNFVDRRGSNHTHDIDAAQKIYEEVLAADQVANPMRLEAYRVGADCHLDKLEEAKAVELLEEAVASRDSNRRRRTRPSSTLHTATVGRPSTPKQGKSTTDSWPHPRIAPSRAKLSRTTPTSSSPTETLPGRKSFCASTAGTIWASPGSIVATTKASPMRFT